MSYIENPKTRGSGIVCCIPQVGTCPNGCEDCFFQSGRSYLEPLEKNLPNMPPEEVVGRRVVRVNDGNDSDVDRELVLRETARYPMRFYNTASAVDLAGYGAPVVLTVNPGEMTDVEYHDLREIPANLMFIRFRTNTWNLKVLDATVAHYAGIHKVPIVLTFMAYFERNVPQEKRHYTNYSWRKRTLNSYYAITMAAWRRVMSLYAHNPLVYSCGKIEGEQGNTLCMFCGNCLREYFAAVERMKV